MVWGNYQEYDRDFVFATIQTLSKDDTLSKYDKTAFDAIVIDEAHHSSASSYKRVLEYFTPKLWLGMTATPDKRDDNLEGRNIYEIFNHQIAYEIRLQNAMEEECCARSTISELLIWMLFLTQEVQRKKRSKISDI